MGMLAILSTGTVSWDRRTHFQRPHDHRKVNLSANEASLLISYSKRGPRDVPDDVVIASSVLSTPKKRRRASGIAPVFPDWNEALERELEKACDILGFKPWQRSTFVKSLRERHSFSSVFRSPSTVYVRAIELKRLDQAYPKLSMVAAVTLAPQLLTFRAETVRRKLDTLSSLSLFQAEGALGAAVTKCPSLLCRSSAGITEIHDCLCESLGQDAASTVVKNYPEMFSRKASTILEQWNDLVDFCGSLEDAQSMIRKNGSLLKHGCLAAKVSKIAETIGSTEAKAKAIFTSAPSIGNLTAKLLLAKGALDTDGAVSPNAPWYAPATLLGLSNAKFNAMLPAYEEWLRWYLIRIGAEAILQHLRQKEVAERKLAEEEEQAQGPTHENS